MTARASKAPARRNATGPARRLTTATRTDFQLLADLLPNDPDAKAAARAHAARRGISVDRLVRQILEAVLADNLVAAVLDDADEIGGRR